MKFHVNDIQNNEANVEIEAEIVSFLFFFWSWETGYYFYEVLTFSFIQNPENSNKKKQRTFQIQQIWVI